MNRIYIIFLLVWCITFSACTEQVPQYHIGISQCAEGGWRELMNEDMRRESLLHPDIRTTLMISSDDAERQILQIDSLIKMKVDLLIVSPTTATDLVPVIEKAYDSGIPVILVDRKVSSQKYTAYVGGDNRMVGKMAADFIIARAGEDDAVFEIEGDTGITPVQDRHEGFSRTLSEAGMDCHSVACFWRPELIRAFVDSIVQNGIRCDYLFCHNDGMAIRVLEAMDDYGLRTPFKIVGVDGWAYEGVQQVKEGRFAATVYYPTGGLEAMRVAAAILHGDAYERETVIPPMIIDKHNAESFIVQYEHLSQMSDNLDRIGEKLSTSLMRYNLQKLLLGSTVCFIFVLAVLLAFVVRAWRVNVRLRKEAEQASNDKLAFFTNVSHDFRTPLTLIADPLRHLCEHPTGDENTQRLVQVAYRNVVVLLRLINQVLDFRRYEAGAMQLRLTRFDLRAAMTDWTSVFVSLADKKNIAFSLTFDADANYMVTADAEKIERITYNLLANAFKFTDKGGSVGLTVRTVSLHQGAESDGVQMCFSDSGIGMEPEQMKHLFERFFQANVQYQGTGIGLALSKAFVDMHHGTIDVVSQFGMGTTFTVTLPRHQKGDVPTEHFAVNPTIDNLREGAVLTAGGTIDGLLYEATSESLPTILVIDDNEDVRTYIHLQLQARYNVLEAADGTDGVMMAVQYVPDIIVCDVMMPGISGVETLHRLKSDIRTSHIPVVMLTASTDDVTQINSYTGGADAFMSKPFNSDVLLSRIANLLSLRREMQDRLIRGMGKDKSETVSDASSANTDNAESRTAEVQEVVTQQLTALDRRFLERLEAYVSDNIANSELKVDDMAAEFSLAHTQFYRKVKAMTGCGPNEYLRSCRLRHSLHMLTDTDLTVAEITYSVGFTSPSYFTKCFREAYGMSPTEYRQR